MTQELLRDDSLPYREYLVRPGDSLDFGIHWDDFLSLRWSSGYPFAASAKIRPVVSTGFQYVTSAAGFSADSEPVWPVIVGATVVDGSITWTCQAIDSTSLQTTIAGAGSAWSTDAPLTLSASGMTNNDTVAIVTIPGSCPDGNYYVRNSITLANSVVKVGVLLMRVRIGTP